MPTLRSLRIVVSPVILMASAAAMAAVACGDGSAADTVEPTGALESEATSDAGADAGSTGTDAAIPTPDGAAAAIPAGGHVSVHGMVLFGSEKLYLSHIPLFATPHNIQVVVEVKIASGVPAAQQAFAARNFTVRPTAPFSLADLARGNVRQVSGTIFVGNFESGGQPAFQNVKFDVQRVVFGRLMSNATPQNPALEYVAVGTPSEAFLVHVIDRQPSFDSIVRVQLGPGAALDAPSLEAGTLVRIADRPNTLATRLGANVVAEAMNLTPTGPEGEPAVSPIRVLNENSCLRGPDFFNPCPPAQP